MLPGGGSGEQMNTERVLWTLLALEIETAFAHHSRYRLSVGMDFSELFADGEASPEHGSNGVEPAQHLSSEDPTVAENSADFNTAPDPGESSGFDLLDLVAGTSVAVPNDDHQFAALLPDAQESAIVPHAAGATATSSSKSQKLGYSLVGKVGKGRHGGPLEQQLVCAHMRAEKRAKRQREETDFVLEALNGCEFSKGGDKFNIAARQGRKGGIQIIMHKKSGKGNRFVRRIHFSKFLRAAYGMNLCNIALAAALDVDSTTIPRLQKTVSGVFMMSQARLLARLYKYCTTTPPATVHTHLKWDETTVATTLRPGGTSESVKSAWSVLVVRCRLMVSWTSGTSFSMRVVMPVVPLMASSADQVYYALKHHPSYYAISEMVRMISGTASKRCALHEVDGAYSNLRLHHHYLGQPSFDPSLADGSFLESARCQSHATHLISVSMLSLLGASLLSKLYGLAVFLRNLGYLLRLQLAVRNWIEDTGS